MSKRRPFRIGLKLIDNQSYRLELFEGISEYLLGRVDVEIVAHEGSPFLEWSQVEAAKLDGLIASIRSPKDLKWLSRCSFPVINTSDEREVPACPTVRVDNRETGRLAARHLGEQGFRQLAYVGIAETANSAKRLDGFLQELPEMASLVFQYHFPLNFQRHKSWSQARKALEKWLKTLPVPCGIFAFSDIVARLVVEAAGRIDRSIPQDFAVIGTGNYRFDCMVARPHLSSVPLHLDKVGYEAVGCLMQLLNGKRIPAEPLLIPPSPVMVRGSSDVLCCQDALVHQAMQLIQQSARKGLQAREVWEALPVSRRSLEMRFKAETGMTLHEAIAKQRLKHAENLLIKTDQTVEQIADQCGFSETRTLIKAFNRFLQMTPGQFRKQFRNRPAMV